jgi:putative ABC transport system permease protein
MGGRIHRNRRSRIDSLYFSDEIPEIITMGALDRISGTGLAAPVPLYVRFRARGFPIVGTTLDYFEFRELEFGKGHPFGFLGECVIGATVAETLGLEPGDHPLSSPETVFDLAGIYPLKMKVAGVLRRTHSADDLAVLVDVKTAWIIEGLGHGHEDLTRIKDTSVILERSEGNVTANVKPTQYSAVLCTGLLSIVAYYDQMLVRIWFM